MKRKRRYEYKMGTGKPVTAYFDDGTYKSFPSRAEAQRVLLPGVAYAVALKMINFCCWGWVEKAFGYRWVNENPKLFPRDSKKAAQLAEEVVRSAEKARRKVKREEEEKAWAASVVGKRFGRLTVVGEFQFKPTEGETSCLCKCDCGATRVFEKKELCGGEVLSCGCVDSAKHLSDLIDMFGEIDDIRRETFGTVGKTKEFV